MINLATQLKFLSFSVLFPLMLHVVQRASQHHKIRATYQCSMRCIQQEIFFANAAVLKAASTRETRYMQQRDLKLLLTISQYKS